MSSQIISLHTEGKLLKGFTKDECKRLMCEKLKLSEKVVNDLISGKEIVLKKRSFA